MNKKYILLLGAVLAFSGAAAQDLDDVLRFSKNDYSYGTARSAAMGGAFSSLGADMASAVINPAGFGMYRGSEMSFSPSLTVNMANSTNDTDFGQFSQRTNRTSFGINNLGGAFNVYEGSGVLTSFTFAFGYTKLNNFNTSTSVIGRSRSSMADAFSIQMNRSNIIPPADGSAIEFTSSNVNNWGGILAYNTFLIEHDADGFFTPGLFDFNNADIESRLRRVTRGHLGQYDISGGFNFSNVLYVGLGFGFQDMYYNENVGYQEVPRNNAGFELRNFVFTQSLRQTLTSWNFKFGAILRPVPELRISAAIHTPNYASVEELFFSDMSTTLTFDNVNHTYTDGVETGRPINYNVQTPTRAMLGASLTLGGKAIISADYERVWYNKIKTFGDGWSFENLDFTSLVGSTFKPADNIRIGGEIIASPGIFVRAGYAYYGSMYKDETLKKYTKSQNYSLGLGYRTGEYGIDFAYIYIDKKDIPRNIFYEQVDDGTVFSSGTYRVKNQQHNFTLTASIRF